MAFFQFCHIFFGHKLNFFVNKKLIIYVIFLFKFDFFKGMINELNVASNTLENYKIPDGAKLVLLVQTTFFFDPAMKGNGIKVSFNFFQILPFFFQKSAVKQ